MTKQELDEGVELARYATKGVWEVKAQCCVYGVFSQYGVKHICNRGAAIEPSITPEEQFQESTRNMEHIAHHSGSYMIRLYEYVESLEKKVEWLNKDKCIPCDEKDKIQLLEKQNAVMRNSLIHIKLMVKDTLTPGNIIAISVDELANIAICAGGKIGRGE